MNNALTRAIKIINESRVSGAGLYSQDNWCLVDCRKDHAFGPHASEAAAKLFKAAPKLLSALTNLLDEVQDLIGESYGVAGLHLNGDVAPWSEIEEGGRFERLCSMSQAIDAIREATE